MLAAARAHGLFFVSEHMTGGDQASEQFSLQSRMSLSLAPKGDGLSKYPRKQHIRGDLTSFGQVWTPDLDWTVQTCPNIGKYIIYIYLHRDLDSFPHPIEGIS